MSTRRNALQDASHESAFLPYPRHPRYPWFSYLFPTGPVVFLAGVFLLASNLPAHADSHSWTAGGGDTSWSTSGNWSGGTPAATDDAVFDLTGTRPVSIGTGDQSISNVTVAGSGNWTWGGSSRLSVSGVFDYNMGGGGSGDSMFGTILAGSGSVTVSGGYRLTLNNTGNSYAGGTLVSAGWLAAPGAGTIGTGPLTLRGGRLSGQNGGTTYTNAVNLDGDVAFGWSSDGVTFTGPVTIMRDCSLTASQYTAFGGGPAFSGNYALRFAGGGGAGISRDNAGWGGAVIMDLDAGKLFRVMHANAVGNGTLTLKTGVACPSDGADVTLAATTSVILEGDIGIGWLKSLNFNGPATLTGNRTLLINKNTTFQGAFASTNRYTLTKTGASATLYIAGDNSAYTGDWSVAQGTLAFSTVNSIGGGQILAGPGAVAQLNVAANWTIPNDLAGGGTINVGSGSADRTLTLDGSHADPGTTNTAGILTVQNGAGASYNSHVAFGVDSRLTIDVLGTGAVAGSDYDQLHVVKGGITGLANADLVVNVAPALGRVDLTGTTLTVLVTDSGALSGVFRSVRFTPHFHAKVNYTANAVTLADLAYAAPGTVVYFR